MSSFLAALLIVPVVLAGVPLSQGQANSTDVELLRRTKNNTPIPSGSYLRSCDSVRWIDDGIVTNGGSAHVSPRGHYEASSDDLAARCRRRDGRYVNTTLRFADECVSRINNVDGRLVCDFQYTQYRPPGSYQRSCENFNVLYFRGGGSTQSGGRWPNELVLYARCRDREGRWRPTSIVNYHENCSTGSVANRNGRLRCE